MKIFLGSQGENDADQLIPSAIGLVLHLMKRNSFLVEHLASFTIEVYSMIEINNKNV